MSTTNPKILATATALPEHTKPTEEILADIEAHLGNQDDRFRQKVLRIFKYAAVERRYSVLPAEKVLGRLSFEERNDLYIEAVTDLSEEVLRKGLSRAGVEPDGIDFLLTVSCTGFMIPSVDAHLINRLRMRPDVVRLPVTEMGCAAGVSALIYADSFLRANPGKRAAIVAVESPMSTFQIDDFSMANMVSAAIFGDGAACAILGPDDGSAPGPVLVDTDMYHFFDETELMGFRLRNSGFEMVLDPRVPERIHEHFPRILPPFLERNGLTIAEIDHLVFHPGGKRIIEMAEALFRDLGKDLSTTRSVLRDYGNMSSATVLFVLDRFLREGRSRAGDHGLMLSFGPGFSAQSVLLRWDGGDGDGSRPESVEETILRSMPYREPFLFVDAFDRITEDGVAGRYRFRPESPFYAGHFPGRPITPGVLLVETMAQIGLVGLGMFLTGAHLSRRELRFALTDSEVAFLRPVSPGEEVTVRAEKVYFRFGKLRCRVEMTNQAGERVCHGALAGMVLGPDTVESRDA